MAKFYYDMMDRLGSAYSNTWGWFDSLDRTQWFVLLGVVTLGGFLCMRGYGSRNNY